MWNVYGHSHLLLEDASRRIVLQQQGLVRKQQGLHLLRCLFMRGLSDPNRSRLASSSRRSSLTASSGKRECARIIVRGNHLESQNNRTDPLGSRPYVGEGAGTGQSLRPRRCSSSTPGGRLSTPRGAHKARRAEGCGRTLFAQAVRGARGNRALLRSAGATLQCLRERVRLV